VRQMVPHVIEQVVVGRGVNVTLRMG